MGLWKTTRWPFSVFKEQYRPSTRYRSYSFDWKHSKNFCIIVLDKRFIDVLWLKLHLWKKIPFHTATLFGWAWNATNYLFPLFVKYREINIFQNLECIQNGIQETHKLHSHLYKLQKYIVIWLCTHYKLQYIQIAY